MTVEKKIVLGFGAALILLITVGIAAYFSIWALIDTGRWVAHTHQVRADLNELIFLMTDSERATMSYILSGDEQHLRDFNRAISPLSQRLEALRVLTQDNPAQQQELQALDPIIAAKVRLLREAVTIRQAEGMKPAMEFLSSRPGGMRLGEIRSLVSGMREEEEQLLAEREQTMDSRSKKTTGVILFGSLLAVLVISASAHRVLRDLAERRRVEQELERLRHENEVILNVAGDGIYRVDLEGKATFVNPTAARMLGWDPSELAGKNSHSTLHHTRPDGRPYPREECPIYAVTRDGIVRRVEDELFWRRDGRSFPVEYISAPINERGKIVGAVVTFRDISARKQAEAERLQAQEELRRSVEELEKRTGDITVLSELGDMLQSCQSAPEAYEIIPTAAPRLFAGWSGALCVIPPSRNLVEAVATWGEAAGTERVFAPNDCWALRRGRPYIIRREGVELACKHLLKSCPSASFCIPLMAQGETLGILHLRSVGGSAPAASEAEQKTQERLATAFAEHVALSLGNLKLRDTLRDQSIRDPLTGLFNRRYLEVSMERELRGSTRHQQPLAVIMTDVDHFKRFNDMYGHEAGDILLSTLGYFLKSHIRAEDIACRYGGEEFALVLPGASLDVAQKLAERLRAGAKALDPTYRGQALGKISISLGLAAYPDHADTTEGLLRAADAALYKAKSGGRDRVVVAGTADVS